ncbi:GNAT family N-acetyltransferase [Plectonema radiosum NIES-515]|uniref:GNAT family N-acetyltransferase n=1 Tax=Plectonema radiosum NIES-515 TaxID=2986073 RepID=A0ABT3AYI2_9CYAN|nr:GNAT family N-acetyltransferase [Plectonema radiosum]MCV3214192.1 GNAT family N-acetyltransferase [Plectonema radiosum NIES-515]
MTNTYKDFLIRNWEERDRTPASEVIRSVLSEYGLGWEPNGADRDVLQVEECYLATGGEFWVIEHLTSTKDSSEITNLQASEGRLRSFSPDFSRQANIIEHQNKIVGTAAYYPIHRGEKAVEIRKMYLLPTARGLGLGKYLLQQLEEAIAFRGFQQIWIETASVLAEAVKLYESSGYQPATGVETARCDRVYVKKL